MRNRYHHSFLNFADTQLGLINNLLFALQLNLLQSYAMRLITTTQSQGDQTGSNKSKSRSSCRLIGEGTLH